MSPHTKSNALIRNSRKGFVLTVELLLILPILLLAVVALLELGVILHGKQKLITASQEGARVASITGNADEVHRVVLQVLKLQDPSDFAMDIITPLGLTESRSGDMVVVVIGVRNRELSLFASNLLGLGNQLSYSRSAMRRE